MSDPSKDVPAAMSTSALESKLRDLREKSNKHSQILTAKLASSQSGQNLLHIGTSLSSLPPDLHSLLTQLHPVLSSAESTEKQYLQRLQRLVQCANEIRVEERRVQNAKECADLYQDLLAAERVVKRDASDRRRLQQSTTSYSNYNDNINAEGDGSTSTDDAGLPGTLNKWVHIWLCCVGTGPKIELTKDGIFPTIFLTNLKSVQTNLITPRRWNDVPRQLSSWSMT